MDYSTSLALWSI